MAALESCPKHNMVAYLEKTDVNAKFHEIIDFFTRNSIHYALTVSLVASTTFVKQFWMNAKSKTINNVRYITATVTGKPVSISKASIRSDLQFNDAARLMCYQTRLYLNPFIKWGKNISGNVTLLFPSMLAQPTEDEGEVLERPSETQPTPSPTHPKASGGNHRGQSSSDRSLSGNEDDLILQSVYDLYVSLCKQVTIQAKQIQDLKAQIKKLKKKAKPVISHHNAWIKSVSMKKRLARKKSLKTKLMQKESVSKQGRKPAKSKPTVHKDPAFDDLDDAMYYMETKDAHDEETVKKQDTDKPNEGTADGNSNESAAPTTVFRDDENITQFLVSMSQNKAKQKGVEIKDAEDSDRPRTTSTRSLLTLKPLPKIDPKDKGKKVLEEEAESDAESEGVNEAERKFAQLANDEEIARKARIEADSILSSTALKKRREKKFLAQQRAPEIRSRPPIITQLRNEMMTYLKHVGGKKHSDLKNKKFEEIQVLYEKIKSSDENFIAIGSTKDEKIIRELNKKAASTKKADSIKEESKEEAGLVIHILVEKKYPLRKKVLLQMLKLKLEFEEDNTMALELIRFVKKLVEELEPEDSDGDEKDL
ncbi:hypothetical protein Tco_0635833 [Tanacetum coccineum]